MNRVKIIYNTMTVRFSMEMGSHPYDHGNEGSRIHIHGDDLHYSRFVMEPTTPSSAGSILVDDGNDDDNECDKTHDIHIWNIF